MTTTQRSPEETSRLGLEIYRRDILPHVRDEHWGRVLSIDLNSGDYAIGDSVIDTTDELWERRPDAEIWNVRVGDIALSRFGGGFPRRPE